MGGVKMGNQIRILLIDDDEDDRWLFVEALSRIAPDVECETASDGIEAIALLEAQKKPLPKKIFLDLNMPGMDGKKFLAQIKSMPGLRSIPVIVYSTSRLHKDIEETKKLGAAQFIIKPSDYLALCEMFRQMFVLG
jgi:CheY-like chemotaxis protein